MADELKYTVSLADKMSGPANAASASLSNLSSQMKRARDSSFGLANGGMLKLAGGLDAMGGSAAGAAGALAEFAGPVGIAVTVTLGLAAAVGAAATAFGELTLQGAKLALEQSGLQQRLEATFDALGGQTGAGKKTVAMLDDMSRALPQTRKELAGWAAQYEALGITDLGSLQRQLQATAAAQALTAESGLDGAHAYENLTRKIQLAVETGHGLKIPLKGLTSLATTGVHVSEVAAKMGISTKALSEQLKAGTANAAKFGDALQAALIEKGQGPLQAMRTQFGTQLSKISESFGRLFKDINVGPFLKELATMGRIFDTNTAAGKANKFLIEKFFNNVFALATKSIPVIRHTFLRMELGALKAYIALKPVIKELGRVFDSFGGWKAIDNTFASIAKSATIAAEAIAKVVGFGVKAGSAALGGANDLGKDIGGAIAGGFGAGIEKAGDWVVGKAKGLARAATNAMGQAAEVKSPSRLTMRIGGHIGAGLAMGIHERMPVVARAGLRIGAAAGIGIGAGVGVRAGIGEVRSRQFPGMPHAMQQQQSVSRQSGGNTINVGGIHITGAGQGAEQLTETAVATLFERLALQQGL